MNTKLRFKLIAILIVFSVVGLVIFQGYWLSNLYDALYKQMEVSIGEAMKIADYKELFLRIRDIKQKKGKEAPQTEDIYFISKKKIGNAEANIEAAIPAKQTDINMTPEDIFHTAIPDKQMKLHIDYGDDADFNSIDSTLTDYFSVLGEVENMVQQTMHANIDSIQPIVYDTYRELLRRELRVRNVDTPSGLIVICKPGNEERSWMDLDNASEFITWKNPVHFDYPIQNDPLLLYRLYLKSPSSVILAQMWGILISSFLLLLLIIIAFIYLLRTILKQKSIEELKTDFTNNMTHELKTPISVSYAAIDVLLNFSSQSVNDKQRKYLTIVKEQLTHLTGLVEQILTLAVENRSTFRLRPENIQLNELIESLTEQYKLKTNGNVAFTCFIPKEIELVADRTHLYNMLSNLLDNAIKYSNQERCHISLKITKNEQETSIAVIDNGPGIAETNLRQIFDKFYRVPNGNLHNVKGYGLGLYYVKDMMDRHGGFVSVQSHLGRGCEFTLHFK